MALQVKTTKIKPDITVIQACGSLASGDYDTLSSVVQGLLGRGEKKLILDLGGIVQIDSLGGMSLVHCFFAAREEDAGLCVAAASPSVTRLFKATGVDTLIPFFPTRAAAEHFIATPKT